jgi:hypothetical protein
MRAELKTEKSQQEYGLIKLELAVQLVFKQTVS